jgi:hypothetical protein
MRDLPADSPYREIVYASIWAALRPLWNSLTTSSCRTASRGAVVGSARSFGKLRTE